MTQGELLSPTIFNVVVDAVVPHCAKMSLAEDEKRRERGDEGRHQTDLFYADGGMVASSDPRWIQWDFDTLVSLFERVGLQNNFGKTVSMVCSPCQETGNQSEEAYGRRMTGGGGNIQGTAERKGTVRVLWERDGGGIIGITQRDTAWAGGRGAVELGSFGHRRRAADGPDGLTDQGRAAELPSGGLPRPGRDKDGNADALFQPACPGHRDHLGGSKPTPPKVP